MGPPYLGNFKNGVFSCLSETGENQLCCSAYVTPPRGLPGLMLSFSGEREREETPQHSPTTMEASWCCPWCSHMVLEMQFRPSHTGRCVFYPLSQLLTPKYVCFTGNTQKGCCPTRQDDVAHSAKLGTGRAHHRLPEGQKGPEQIILVIAQLQQCEDRAVAT